MNQQKWLRGLSAALICSVTGGNVAIAEVKFSAQPASAAQPSQLSSYAQSWTGVFGDRKIGFFIESLTATQIRGYSVVGQNKRPFQGSVQRQGSIYLINAREPMTQASDGVFQLRLDPTSPRQIQGTWRSGQADIAAKTFSLTPRACEASKTAGDYDGSVRSLTGDELQTDPWTLSMMRNEIYARHGYAFADWEIAAEFAEKDWYIPCSSNVEAKLSSLERANIQKLRKAEAYAKTREWGR